MKTKIKKSTDKNKVEILLKNNNFRNNQNYILSKNEKINLFYFMYGVKYENGLTNFMIFLFIILLLILNGISSYRLAGEFISSTFFIGLFIILLFLMLFFTGFKRILYNTLSKRLFIYKNVGDNYNEIYSKYTKISNNSQAGKTAFYSNPILDKIDNFNLFIEDKVFVIKK